ncbi:hypothetical protein [Streptomyces asoensis]|uniref:hypothetical protein n=1 Tax=Streptomyces asoensis TaxID=249586 RepID=UPI0033CE4F18
MDKIGAIATSPGGGGEEVLQEVESLLLRALWEDLRMPRQQRRVARPVLLVELPPLRTEGARATERFFIALHRAASETAEQRGPSLIGGPLVIAVGQPSDSLLHLLHNPPESNLQQAARALRHNDGAPVLLTLPRMALDRPSLQVSRAKPVRFRLSWRVMSRLQAALLTMGRRRLPVPSRSRKGIGNGQDAGRRRLRARTAVSLWIIALSAAGWLGLHELLESFQAHGRLGPSDAPAVVTTIVALGTATGTLIGVTLTAYAKYVQARGQAESDLVRAKADLMRAEADMIRARAHLPAADAASNGDSPAVATPPEPDAG